MRPDLNLFTRSKDIGEGSGLLLLISIISTLIGGISGCNGGKDVIDGTDTIIVDGGTKDIIDTGDSGADGGGCAGGCGSNASCVNGECVCNTGYGNCNSDWSDGCEVDLNSLSTCGSGCDSIVNCSTLPNVRTARCEGGLCVIGECRSGYDDCDGRIENGCEANLSTDAEHCGSCSTSCGENSVCNNKVCACEIGYGNCNDLWSDGCEVDLSTDVTHCGDCQTNCNDKGWANVSGYRCQMGSCSIISCSAGFGNCDGDNTNGCEVNFNLPTSCGTSCADVKKCGENSTCTNGECGCISGYGNCNNDWIDGCEVNLETDVTHCGDCATDCNSYTYFCINNVVCELGICGYDSCKDSRCIDRNGIKTDGCEFWEYLPKTYGEGNEDRACCIKQTTDGGYIAVGNTTSFGAGSYDLWVLKLDSDGGIEWQRSYGESGSDYAHSIQETTDGGYIVAGETYSFGAGSYDFWVLKLGSSGGIEWQRSYGGGNVDVAYSIKQTRDDGYIVAGYTNSFGAGEYDMWILKLDSNGGVEWQRSYGGGSYDYASSIQQTADDGYIVAGETYSFGAGRHDFWVLKLGSNGGVEWQRSYGGGSYDHASSIQETRDGGYIVGGETRSFGAGEYDMWVLKLDSSGGVEWQRSYGGSGSDSASFIQETTDNGYIVAGYTRSFGAGNDDMWVLKLDSSGGVEWQRSYGGDSHDAASSIQETTDGGYIVAGYTRSFGAGEYDMWVLKLNSDGSVDGSCPSGIGAVTNVTANTTSATTTDTTASANPTSGAEGSTSATLQDTSTTTDMQCTPP